MEVRQVQQDLQDTKRGTTMDFFNCVPVSIWKAVQSSGKNLSLNLLKTTKSYDKRSNFDGL